MSAPELLFETMAPMTGHNTTWHLEYEGRPVDVKLERGTQPVSITNLDTGRDLKTTSPRGAAIFALALDAYRARFGDDPTNPKEEIMTQHNEKSPAPAATGNEGNKSIEERSTTTAYLAYNPDDTRRTFGTWSGDDLPMTDYIRIIVPLKTARLMHRNGPQLIELNAECVTKQAEEVRKQREERAAKEREEKLRRLRREIEDTIYADELDALEDRVTAIYARVDAEAQARLDAQGQEAGQ